MEILGVGVPEIAFIVLIALILLGPKDMVAAGRTIGKLLRKFITSPTWSTMRRTGEELQQLPTRLIREAGLEDIEKDMQGLTNSIKPVGQIKPFDESQIFGINPEQILPDSPSNLPESPSTPKSQEKTPEPPTTPAE